MFSEMNSARVILKFYFCFCSGGGRRVPVDLPEAYKHNFVGCVAHVNINSESLRLVEDRTNHQVMEFCDPWAV